MVGRWMASPVVQEEIYKHIFKTAYYLELQEYFLAALKYIVIYGALEKF